MKKSLIERMINMYDDLESDRPYSKLKVVAFIIYKGKIISFGVNSEKTSLYQYRTRCRTNINQERFVYDKTHAEIAAIKKVNQHFNDWRHTTIFVVSKKKDGTFRFSKPCPICDKAIKEKGIRRIYYTNSCGGINKEFYN